MKPGHPTSILPALEHISSCTYKTASFALINLRLLYWTRSYFPIGFTDISGTSGDIIDSGYASAEEGEKEGAGNEENLEELLETLRNDPIEKDFAIKWLIGFISRSEQWVEAVPGHGANVEEEREGRIRTIDEATQLLALFADTQTDGVLTRNFTFSLPRNYGGTLAVELDDESYEHDHEGVGLQTWGSATVLANCICAQPEEYLPISSDNRTFKLLELGAGTGLLSIVVTKLLCNMIARCKTFEVVASDFHPEVLENLRRNTIRNFKEMPRRICVKYLDWSEPPLELFGQFDIILAADVIYDPRHSHWIKSCVEKMLRRTADSAMWLIIPQRPTRVDEINKLNSIFNDGKLRILSKKQFVRSKGVGRIDEDGYTLFRIGWGDLQ